jgi:NADH-quinone oxidoreductase subunit N
MSPQDFLATLPLMIVSLTALAVVLFDALSDKTSGLAFWLSLAGLGAAAVIAWMRVGSAVEGTAFSGMVTTGSFANFFTVVFSTAGFLSLLLSSSTIRRQGLPLGEYLALVLLSVAGMMMMAAAADLIVFFVGLEIMSVSFYVLAGFARTRAASNEAAMKYFLLGSFATGFLLYGIALLYGSTGTTAYAAQQGLIMAGSKPVLLLAGLALLLIGLAFKIAAVPFHMWVPDVYEGSPTPVSGFMSTGGKAAAFAGILLAFSPLVVTGIPQAASLLAGVAALSMVTGNVLAIAQSSVKRMLAYSSVAHAGYILTGILSGNSLGYEGVLFYLLVYTLMNVGAFGVVSVLESAEGKNLTFEDFAGLGRRAPWTSLLMAVFMFSLTGIPPFAGFLGKYYVFAGAVKAGYTWVAIVGVLMSVISAYYYLRLVVMMYFRDQEEGVGATDQPLGYAALAIASLALVGFGLFPGPVLGMIGACFPH